jgi:hypothetical protein
MKKMVFVLTALLLTVPATAAVDINCAQVGPNEVQILYDASADEPNKPRAFGLVISVDVCEILSVSGEPNYPEDDNDYWVYPGSIIIDTNDPPSVSDQGSPAVGSLPASSIIVEMGSLHYPADVNSVNAPALSGVLLSVYVSGDCNVTVAEDATRGGVVNYDAEAVTINNLTPCHVTGDCFPACHPDYTEWVNVGKPTWWCNPRQCRGEADNAQEVSGHFSYWVAYNDLQILVDNWKDKAGLPAAYQADFSHSSEVSGHFTYRVAYDDLDIIVDNWKDKLGSPADCLDCP